MTSETSTEPEAIQAATVVIYRNGPAGKPAEILVTIRSRNMTFAGGMAVFPGGRVDEADFELARKLTVSCENSVDLDEIANQIAAVRETLEETGLAIGLTGHINAAIAQRARKRLLEVKALAPILDEFGWTLDLGQLTPFARWYPKNERIPRVYDTRFYLADVGTGAVDIEADLSENTHLFWTSPQDALEAAGRGDIKVIFPTRRNLERLALFSSFAEAKAQADAIPVRTIVPQIDESSGQPMLTIMEDAGYPITAELLESVKRG
jgi:8-oxo-dGTP pyrophosphatase MutT (NUDIX family)